MNKSKTESYIISILDNSLEVILTLGSHEGMSIRELGKEVEIPKSTLYRVLRTLEAKDFIRQDISTEKYSLGLKFFELGMMLKEKFELKNLASPYIAQLRDKTRETIQLAIVDRETILILETVEGLHDLRVFSRAGRRFPITYGNFGKIFLSDYQNEEVIAMLEKYPLKQYASNSIVDNQKFMERLNEVRAKGVSVGIDDPIEAVFAIAAPIRNNEGKTIAAISIAGAKTESNIINLQQFEEKLLDAANMISRQIYFLK